MRTDAGDVVVVDLAELDSPRDARQRSPDSRALRNRRVAVAVAKKMREVGQKQRRDGEALTDKRKAFVIGSKSEITFEILAKNAIAAPKAIAFIDESLPASVIRQAVDYLDIQQGDLLRLLGIAPSSFHRKLAADGKLSHADGERVFRLAEVTRLSTEVFGDAASASDWLQRDNAALGGQPPLAMFTTDIGAREVRRVLNVINYGGVL